MRDTEGGNMDFNFPRCWPYYRAEIEAMKIIRKIMNDKRLTDVERFNRIFDVVMRVGFY